MPRHPHSKIALLACLLGAGAGCVKSQSSVTALEARVAHLEEVLTKRESALAFLDEVYEQKVDAETRPKAGTVYGVDIQPNLALGQVIGPPDALVTVVEAWDFACPHCYRASLVLDELLTEYQGKLRLVLKHMVVHPQQVAVAHLAACAAAKQGKFKDFYKAYWDNGFKTYMEQRDDSVFSMENVMKTAGEVGLNADRLQGDMVSCQGVVDADEAELRKFKVNGTPAFFINGEFVGGGIPKEAFKQIIDQKLAVAEKSGVPGASYYDKEIRGKGEKSVERPAKRGSGGSGQR